MEHEFKYTPSVLIYPLVTLIGLWIIFAIDQKFYLQAYEYGIFPRTFEGLAGIVFSPLVHGSAEHLLKNSFPLLALLVALRYFYYNYYFRVLGYGILISGVLTWLIGRPSYHIGASSIVYLLASFMFFKGLQTKFYRLMALSFTIVLMYGGIVWYMFPMADDSVSWEGHLAGFITGVLLSYLIATPVYMKKPVYEWEKPDYNPADDAFMRQFDDQGNFFEIPKPDVDKDDVLE